MKNFVLAVAFSSVFAAGAMAQTAGQGVLRDPPFGKGNTSNDTMHQPNSAGSGHGYSSSDQGIPPRDPPFGKAGANNDTVHLPSSAGTAHTANQIPPRDPPFGKGM